MSSSWVDWAKCGPDSERLSRRSVTRKRQQELRVIDALTAASMVNTVASAVQANVPWIDVISG